MIGGFRRGELLGVEWPDVDFIEGTLSIKKSISMTKKGQAVEKGPKSKSSKRIIDFPDWYMEELKIHRKEWRFQKWATVKEGRWLGQDREYIFHAGFGKPSYHTTPTGWWIDFVKRHGLKRIKLHELRHSSATLFIEAGASMKAVQKRLGHSKNQTTADIYAHVIKRLSRSTAEKFNTFDPKNRPQSVLNSK